MSDIIHVLPDSIANQIAAGEVIQRPASILKELVENSLDAGAKRIIVEVEEAGKASLKVTDDGCGMSQMDARMAFERHATSKISDVQDLFSLRSMGFRGEALASIASVAQVELTTRCSEDEMATQLTLNSSDVVSVRNVAAPVGSSFMVRNVFFNVPARRRFLKSNQTELKHLIEQFERIVLVYPGVSFSFYSDGNLTLNLPATTQRRRITDTLGQSVDKGLIPIHFENEISNINGFVSLPDCAKKRGAEQFLFVNGRYMRHPYFHRAILSVYEKLLSPGYAPNYFLFFSIDPSRIDVNIHPTKTEIKFLDEQAIFKLLAIAIRQSLSTTMAVPTIDFEHKNVVDIPIYSGKQKEVLPSPDQPLDPNYNPFNSTDLPTTQSSAKGYSAPPSRRPKVDWKSMFESFEQHKENRATTFSQKEAAPISPESCPVSEKNPPENQLFSTQENFSSQAVTLEKTPCFLHDNKYIVSSVSRGVVLIDYKRAQQRIIYEEVKKEFAKEGKEHATRKLLFPELCAFPTKDVALVDSLLPELESIGFEISSLGGGSYSILAVPEMVETDAKELVEQIISDALEQSISTKDALIEILALKLSNYRGAISNLPVSPEGIEALIAKLFSCQESTYTPQGKLIMRVLSNNEIQQSFD
ncbi:DNA mismatch repair endonuclease MutL [Porphyromonas endodontalis]|uniref:DNA mismatch repair endonuclease MutL n=1 Tax=Porphyromonas endodontalis TaxID=28124 RepID=UPI0026F0E0E9|nr:DNA mismatch repair endonuclease MutL [Porphyromonas endodontalis]